MPSFDLYKKLNNTTSGQAKKIQSWDIVDNTWFEDTASQIGYFYDYFHNNEDKKLRNLHPEKDKYKVGIPIKFFQNTAQSMDKDQVTFHIQFMHKFDYQKEFKLKYYDEVFGIYDSLFPIGMYVDIIDSQGRYNKWLVCAKANYYDNEFPTFEVLPCEWVFQYITNGIKYEMPGVLRTQSSYVMRFIWETIYRKFLNCWELSIETISSQGYA